VTSPESAWKEAGVWSLDSEATLIREIKDIMDELHIMKAIMDKQNAVRQTFAEYVHRQTMLNRHRITNREASSEFSSIPARRGWSGPTIDSNDHYNPEEAEYTLHAAEALSKGMQDRTSELESLEKAAKHASSALEGLLALKQQYVVMKSRTSSTNL